MKKSTKDIEANLPSRVENQAIKDVKGVFSTKIKKVNTKSFRFFKELFVYRITKIIHLSSRAL